jgi:hypothetical protein
MEVPFQIRNLKMNASKADWRMFVESGIDYKEDLLEILEATLDLMGLDPDTVEDLTNCAFKEQLRCQEEENEECYEV